MVSKRCSICNSEILEEGGKISGTMLRVIENKKANFIYVCPSCQKDSRWIEKAKVRAA